MADLATAENAPDAACASLLALFRAEMGAAVVGAEIQRHEIIVRVRRDAWVEAATVAKRKLGLTYFCFISGMDWLDNPTQTSRYENVWGSVEEEVEGAEDGEPTPTPEVAPEPEPTAKLDPAPEPTVGPEAAPEPEAEPQPVATLEPEPEPVGFRTGVAGGDSRFQVMMRVVSPTAHRGLTIKADLDDTDPRVATLSGVYAGADWHERETWEMFGFWFDGHPNLIHIYLPHGFEGYPLRKDFPLLAREVKPWPGLTNVEPISGQAEEEVGAT